MRSTFLLSIILLTGMCLCLKAQTVKELNLQLPQILEELNDESVPYITVQDLQVDPQKYTILDTRQKKEYDISHLPGAVWVGQTFKKKRIKHIERDKPVVVYCTIGVRSEDYGQRLLASGFSQVYNLYGSIFYWKDSGFPLVNAEGVVTDSVHIYSKEWGRYLNSGIKVY